MAARKAQNEAAREQWHQDFDAWRAQHPDAILSKERGRTRQIEASSTPANVLRIHPWSAAARTCSTQPSVCAAIRRNGRWSFTESRRRDVSAASTSPRPVLTHRLRDGSATAPRPRARCGRSSRWRRPPQAAAPAAAPGSCVARASPFWPSHAADWASSKRSSDQATLRSDLRVLRVAASRRLVRRQTLDFLPGLF